MDADQVLAFRLARSGLARRSASSLAGAAACPASDFSRDAALLALAARRDGVTREAYDRAVDGGEVVVAHVVRGAIHALAPADLRALRARPDRRPTTTSSSSSSASRCGGSPPRRASRRRDALDEVAAATKDALGGGRTLSKNELHEELRGRVGKDLMPWCKGCGSHHVAPMLWRYGTVKAGARLDSERRYVLAKPGRAPAAGEAVKRFLSFYGPATAGDFADWAGLAKPHAERLWARVEDDLAEVAVGKRTAWIAKADRKALDSPPGAKGVRLIPPGDPYLQKPNRPLLAPEAELRKRLFRPVASPGAVLKDGRLVGLWRVKAKGKKDEITVEKLGRLARKDLEEEAQRIAELRGASEPLLLVS